MHALRLYMSSEVVAEIGPLVLLSSKKISREKVEQWIEEALADGPKGLVGVAEFLVEHHDFANADSTTDIVIDKSKLGRSPD